MVKHGLCGTDIYNVWLTMKQRCYNANDRHFKWYGAKGISVCDEWKNDPAKFAKWAVDNGYKKGLTIDRIDGSKNYSPDNCRFITMSEQQRNRSSNRSISFDGKTMCIQEWAELLKITPSTLRARFRKGWSIEKALTQPVRGLSRK